MKTKKYILKRNWQSKSGIQEELYLGYDNQDKLDCIADLPKAKKMTQEECEEFKAMLPNNKVWVIDVLPEDSHNEKDSNETNNEEINDGTENN